MNIDFINAMYEARRSAKMTQNTAAERVDLSPRTIASYEAGMTVPPDASMARMVMAYSAPWLGYLYLSTVSPTGQLLLPKVLPHGVASTAICLRLSLARVSQLIEEIDAICCDDIITQEERREFEKKITPKLRELTAACMAMQIVKIPETAGTASGKAR